MESNINEAPADHGKKLYEESLKQKPAYHDGKPRKTWDELGEVEKWSWTR